MIEEFSDLLELPNNSKNQGNCEEVEIVQKNSPIRKRKIKAWTQEQDATLLELCEQFPKDWPRIAQHLYDRNENQCLHRYRRICLRKPNQKKWTSEEDQLVTKYIKKYGKNWKTLSQIMTTKTPKQIRQRFINKLDPKIRKDDWTLEEDKKIIALYCQIGSKWSEISKQLSGRSENSTKNRFYSSIKKNYDFLLKNTDKSGKQVVRNYSYQTKGPKNPKFRDQKLQTAANLSFAKPSVPIVEPVEDKQNLPFQTLHGEPSLQDFNSFRSFRRPSESNLKDLFQFNKENLGLDQQEKNKRLKGSLNDLDFLNIQEQLPNPIGTQERLFGMSIFSNNHLSMQPRQSQLYLYYPHDL